MNNFVWKKINITEYFYCGLSISLINPKTLKSMKNI